MSEKVKVPKWFDEWFHHVYEASCATTFEEAKPFAISKIMQHDLSNSENQFTEPALGLWGAGRDSEFWTPGRARYVYTHKLYLTKALIDGYEIEKEKGYVMLEDTTVMFSEDEGGDGNEWSLYAYFAAGVWGVKDRPTVVTQSEYDNAPAWVKACDFVPIEDEVE
jgi:hypothetical protein